MKLVYMPALMPYPYPASDRHELCNTRSATFAIMSYFQLIPLLRSALFVAAVSILGNASAQNAAMYIAEGNSLLEQDRGSKAMEQFEKAVSMERSARTLTARANASFSLGRMDRFLLDVGQALKLDSTYAPAHYQMARYAQRGKDPDSAIIHSTKAIASAPDSIMRANAHLIRGEARAQQKQTNAAISDLEIGTATILGATVSMSTLAQLYDVAGRPQDALTVLERLCSMEPDDIGHWSNRSFELVQLGRYDEAMTMVQRALLMDKDEPVALSNRAYINMMMGRNDEAMSDVSRSLKNFPQNPYALRTRAMLRLKNGDRVKACDDLSLAKILGDIPEVDQLLQEHCEGGSSPRRK